jgi:hypothetical protein
MSDRKLLTKEDLEAIKNQTGDSLYSYADIVAIAIAAMKVVEAAQRRFGWIHPDTQEYADMVEALKPFRKSALEGEELK